MEASRRGATGCGLSACTTYAAGERTRSVLGPGDRVGGGERPLRRDACDRERSAVVRQCREPSSRGRARGTGRASRGRGQRRGRRGARPRASPCGSLSPRSPGSPAAARRRPGRRHPTRVPAGTTAAPGRAAPRRARPARGGGTPARPRFEKYARGTLSGRRSGSRRRIETTSDAGRERVSPLRRRGHPGADDRDLRRVLVRLVRVHRAGQRGRAPDGPSRSARAGTTLHRRS